MTRLLTALSCVCLALLASGEFAATQGAQGAARQAPQAAWPPVLAAPAAGEVQVLPVQGNVHVIVGAGANITVQAGDDGIMLVDTGLASMSGKVLAAMKTISTRPLRYIVNTTEFDDHVGGNAAIADTGEIIPFREANYTAGPQGALDVTKASVVAYYTMFHRLAAPTGKTPRIPEAGWPDNTFSIEQKRLSFNNEPVVIMHRPSNTDGNSIVLFRKSDVVSVGDLLDLTRYPVIDTAGGGGIAAFVESLNRLIDVTVPAAHAAGGTLVVAGHGRIADHAEVVYYRDMMTIVRDRVQDMIKKGMTLAQVKAARPTRDYDKRYGAATGSWTTDMFVEAVYQSLKEIS
ncbi:MAG: MBL fold metallo-hydrolase [Acidobacteria bacterium]|nr:MBL fold metallo-hydrolase [Acidobacteriota bacterium]